MTVAYVCSARARRNNN